MPTTSSFRVEELITYALDRVSERARDRGITLSHMSHIETASGDVLLLRRAIVALLVHAIRTTPRNGAVTVEAARTSSAGAPMLIVNVADGAGAVFSDSTPRPLSTFLPASAESGPRKGITLDEVGLAFCELLSTLHGGSAWVVSDETVGNVLSFSIPIFEQGADDTAHSLN